MIEITAKSLLLDVLRSTQTTAWPVKKLIEVAGMFDIRESAVRVTLSRLVARGLIETNEPGSYLITSAYDPVRNWIDDWKAGERRVVEWNRQWLCVYPPTSVRKKDWQALDKAARRLGFRLVQERLWVRPDNLAMTLHRMNELLDVMSGVTSLVFATATQLHADNQDLTLESLWDRSSLEQEYKQCTLRLKRSMSQQQDPKSSDALRESILVGGEAIRLLAVDPLLPNEMIDTALRAELDTTTRIYNDMYHQSWTNFLDIETIERVPINLISNY